MEKHQALRFPVSNTRKYIILYICATIDSSWLLPIPEKADCTLTTTCWVGCTVIDSDHLYPEKINIALLIPQVQL